MERNSLQKHFLATYCHSLTHIHMYIYIYIYIVDAELCGRVISVDIAKPMVNKLGNKKAVWHEVEDFYNNRLREDGSEVRVDSSSNVHNKNTTNSTGPVPKPGKHGMYSQAVIAKAMQEEGQF